jgi:feruloyl esterase
MRSLPWLGISFTAAWILFLGGCSSGNTPAAVQGPLTLSYASETIVYAIRTPIAPNIPTSSGGAVTVYSVSPALPAGLSLNATTGVISGTPAIATPQSRYTVTAANSGGSTTATLTITTAKLVPSQPVIACADIQQLDFPDTQITTSTLVPANSNVDGYTDLPEHCLVQGIIGARTGYPAPVIDMYGALDNTLEPSANYGIHFELRMPTTAWNGDFYFTGGSGNDGVVALAVGPPLGGGNAYQPALYRGFAVITQDSGHIGILNTLGSIEDTAGNQNNGFGYDPQARDDYGSLQTGTVTPIAKSILAAFYGMDPVYSYYLGCSNGGREAMIASEQWGDMFDGVVAGDPGFRLPHAAIAEAWESQQFANAAEAVLPGSITSGPNGKPNLVPAMTSADLNLVGQLVLAQCDALDGIADGMIFNTAGCKQQFDPATLSTLQCPTPTKAQTCLLPAQVTAMQNVFAGPTDSQGNPLYSDWPYDVGIPDPKWMMWTIGITLPGPIPLVAENVTQGATSMMYLFSSPPNPELNIFTVPMDDLETSVSATDSTYKKSAVNYMEATSTNLDTFKGNNGKIIYYHGESDPVFSMYDTVSYYDRLTSRYGSGTAGFARLFLIPGMNHCSGGLHTLDSFDPLTAILNWVETGTAPDSILAANSNASQASTLLPLNRTRPLCPYPQYAQYAGTGDTNSAASFICVAPSVGDATASKSSAKSSAGGR